MVHLIQLLMLKQQLGLRRGTPIMERTVSGCVLDISRVLGCKKVLFVGQDMSVEMTEDTIQMTFMLIRCTYHNQDGGQRLPGNTLEKVLVEPRLFVYLRLLSNSSKKNSEVEYRNLARTD